jgi:streptogrisin C
MLSTSFEYPERRQDMKSIALVGACATVATAVAVTSVAASYASSSNPKGRGSPTTEIAALMDQGLSHVRAVEALNAQSEVEAAKLVGGVEAALGAAYAGVWFDPATAKLHVGVVSDADVRTVKELAVKAGLSNTVVETPVRSTWAELAAVQSQWNKWLAKPAANGEAITGLSSKHNAVSITLTSDVSPQERAAFKDKAAAARVNVLVSVVPASRFRIERTAACKGPFETKKAFCEKTLVSGVGIKTGLGGCTAGPILIEGNESYMITAGHCFGSKNPLAGSLVAENVTSEYPTGGGQKEIGTEGKWFEGADRDVAEVRIARTSPFVQAFPNPIPALVTEWTKNPKTPHVVDGEGDNIEGTPDCHQGQTSGEQCGTVGKLNAMILGTEHLVEDTACGEPGDSGGPYFLRDETANKVLMQGINVASNTAKKCSEGEKGTWYEPLKDLAAAKGFGIISTFPNQKLLTTANETRPVGGEWDVNGTRLVASAALSSSALVLAHGKLEVVGAGVTIECAAGEVSINGGEIISPDELRAKDLTFKECAATGANCSLAGTAILTLPLHGHAQLDGTLNALISVLPLPSKTFAVLSFLGEKCALAGTNPITGTADVLIPEGRDPAVLHLVSAFSLAGSLKVGSSEGLLTGFDGDLRLESGQTWNFL